jgi:hypothetical protein
MQVHPSDPSRNCPGEGTKSSAPIDIEPAAPAGLHSRIINATTNQADIYSNQFV